LKLSKKDLIIYASIILAALAIRIIALSLSDNVWGGDPDECIRLAVAWLNVQTDRPVFPSNLWLPLHFYLIALAIKIFSAIPFGIRMMHLIFGTLTIIPFYELVRLIFNKRAAFFSSLLLAFYPLHIVCSATTLSQSPFLFFLVSALFFFFIHLKKDSVKALTMCAVCLICATMIRYEAWPFIILLPSILFIEKKFDDGFSLLIAGLVFPARWLTYPGLTTITYVARHLKFDINNVNLCNIWSILSWWFAGSVRHNLSLAGAVLLLAVVFMTIPKIFKDKAKIYLLCFVLTLFMFFVFTVLLNMSAWNKEISVICTTFAIPFVGAGFDELTKKRFFLSLRIFAVLIFVIISMTGRTVFLATKICRYEDYVKKAGNFLKRNASKESYVLLNNYNYESNHIPVYIGSGLERFVISGKGGDKGMTEELNIRDFILNKRPEYIVYTEEGVLKELFTEKFLFNKDIIPSISMEMETGPYKVYRVRYQ
jgi:hypothetical protein